MGNCFHCCEARGPESDADAEISLKDKSVQKKEKKTHRVLLLGPGDSGKTTLLNQMRKLHGSIRSDNSIDTIKDVIKTNIVKYMAILTAKSKEFGIELSSNDNYQYAQLVLEYAMSMENSKLSNFDSRDDINMSMNMNMNGNNNDLNLNTSLNRRFVNSYKNVPSNIIKAIKILWNDDGIKECLNNRYKYQIDDNVGYFFDSIDRVFDESFDPSDEDILRLRMRTTGFGEQTFQVYFEKPNFKNKHKNNHNNNNNVNNNNNDSSNNNNNNNDDNNISREDNNMNSNENSQYTLRRIKPNESLTAEEEKKKEKFVFIDVGGQRSERRKWMNVMMGDQSIQAVLYLVAISEFDLTCFEDHSTRRLDEAMNLFKECAMKGILDDKTVSIFFNKYDLFEEKLKDKRINFRDYYPEYTNDIRNESEIVEFVANKFKRIYYERFDTPNTNNSGNTNTNNTNGNNLYNLRLKPTISNSNNTNATMNNINVNSNNNNNNNSKNSNSNYGTLNSATPNSPLSTSHTNNINNNNNNNNGNKNNRMGLNGKQSTKIFLQNHNELGVDRVNSTESTMESKFAENSELNGKEHSDVISHSQTNDTMLDAFSSRVYSDSDTFFFHCTCALDTKQIETIMKDIQIKLISKNFKQVGFM